MRSLFSIICLFALLACSKGNSNAPVDTAPSQLVITSTVSTDGSGKVLFKATAKNAATYQFDFGNGVSQPVPTGEVEYTYTTPGTNNYVVTVRATSSNGQSITKSVQVSVSVADNTPGLVWSDEFNTNGAPDPSKWGYDLGGGGWGNNELQYYTNRPENVIVNDGKLKITARKENYQNYTYTSARILSKGKYEFKYGKVEVSAKLPAGVGTWPAIWALGANINTAGWPACGEIDIMEHVGKSINKIYGTLHYPGRSGGNADGNTRMIENATTQFHKYTLDWSATSIRMYVDDQLVHSVNNSLALPFNHDFFFIMNVAMGGNFGGPMDPAVESATMEVDYIRVYRN